MFAKDLGQLLEAHLILSGLVGGVGIFGNTMQRTQFCQNDHFFSQKFNLIIYLKIFLSKKLRYFFFTSL